MEIKWIKLATNIFDDEKILLIEQLPEGDGVIVIWFKLLTLAGKQNNNGVFMLNNRIPYTIEMLSTIFRRKQNLVHLALETFKNLGMIEILDNAYSIPNWNKHQAFLERKDYMRDYMKNRRQINDVSTNVNTPVNIVNTQNKNKKENKKEKENKNKKEENYYNDNFVEDNVMESDGNFNRLERLLVWSYLPKKGQPLTYLEGNLLIEWLQKYPPDYIEQKITQCALQPESKRSLAYLKGAIEKGWEDPNNALREQKVAKDGTPIYNQDAYEEVIKELKEMRKAKEE